MLDIMHFKMAKHINLVQVVSIEYLKIVHTFSELELEMSMEIDLGSMYLLVLRNCSKEHKNHTVVHYHT